VDRLTGDAEERADLGPAEAGVTGAAYGDLFSSGQVALRLADGRQVTDGVVVVGAE